MVDKSIQNTCPLGHGDYYGTECPSCADGIPELKPTGDYLELTWGWEVEAVVDDDGHLNIYIEHTGAKDSGESIEQIETTQGSGKDGEQYALRFTTDWVERKYCG